MVAPAQTEPQWGCIHGGRVGINPGFSLSLSRALSLSLSLSLSPSLFLSVSCGSGVTADSEDDTPGPARAEVSRIQGYLADKKLPPPLGPP